LITQCASGPKPKPRTFKNHIIPIATGLVIEPAKEAILQTSEDPTDKTLGCQEFRSHHKHVAVT
jgi:hypothetical protein